MEPITNATVYIVDDDASVREALAWLLRSRRLPSESFDSAEAFDAMLQKRPPQRQPCCLLLDVRMPSMSGLALFDVLAARGDLATMPVIFLTARRRERLLCWRNPRRNLRPDVWRKRAIWNTSCCAGFSP